MEEFKANDMDHIIVDGKKYKRTKGLRETCGGCVFHKEHNCYLDGMMACKGSDIWVLDEDQTVADDRKTLLLEYFKWLDKRGMLDKSLCYDPEHQTETFLELRERKRLPKTWEEFCEMAPIKSGEAYIDEDSGVCVAEKERPRYADIERNVLPNQKTAEAVLALCQLIQLRDCYNDGWMPDWEDPKELKYCVEIFGTRVSKEDYYHAAKILHFKTEGLRDLFLNNFRDLIEKLKPLYGIEKGGEE